MTNVSVLLLLLHVNFMALQGCSNVEVQWQCEARGSSNRTCCESLDRALSLIQTQEVACEQQLRVNLTFYSTTEELSSNAVFSNANFSQVVFEAPNGVQVECKTGAGGSLWFDGRIHNTSFLMDIHINNIEFLSCGPGVHKTVSATLFFTNNCRIQIHNSSVEKSRGAGLAIVDTVGSVSVTRSNFSQNVFEEGFGGGVHLTIAAVSGKTEFAHCIFRDNQVVPLQYNDTKGGGFYVQYRNHSKNGVLHISDCEFSQNKAQWGGGLLAMFNDNAHNNTLFINSSIFNNNCNGLQSYSIDMAGAGAAITIYSNATSNRAFVTDCNFTGNAAPWGGGLMIFSKPALMQDSTNNSLIVSGCVFRNNSAHTGAAIHIYCTSPASSPQHCNAYPVVAQSVFVNNKNLETTSALSQSPHSIVYVAHFPTLLKQKIEFFNNFGTPLHVHETSVTLNENTVLNFTQNSAQNGGGIMLYGSWIAVSSNNTLLFHNNTAEGLGGAIYSFMTEEVYLPYSRHCFIKSTVSNNPEHWNVRFNFSGNSPSAIYSTSILPCVHYTTKSKDVNIRRTFCTWRNWSFGKDNCMDQILTSPRNFSSTVKNMSAFPGIPSQHRIYAVDDFGHDVPEFFVYPTVLYSSTDGVTAHVTNKTLTVYGHTGTNVSIRLQLEASRTLFTIVNVSLQDCPPGFAFDSPSLSCICKTTRHTYCDYGSKSQWNAYLLADYCMSYSEVKLNGVYQKHIVFGRCPFTSGLQRHFSNGYSHLLLYLPLPLEKEELNTKFCGKLNRTGILCGECIANFSIDLISSTFRCLNCSGSLTHWLIYITGEGVPPLIFFVIVLLLHISLTSGPLNGFIFFSQVLTVSVEVILLREFWLDSSATHPKIFSSIIVKVYSIWSLDFFRFVGYKVCLGTGIKVMHVLVLRYLSALYPLCFLVIAFTVIELHARNCRLLVWLWRPLCFLCVRFRQAWKARTSILDAFAAFILLSYVKIVRISLLLTSYTRIFVQDSGKSLSVLNYDPTVPYLSKEHAPFWFIAVVWLLTFGLVPPILLTCYQFKFFQRFLHWCKLNGNGLRIFMDTFQGCYKDGREGGPDRRYFAGLYFIFRFIVFGIFDMALTLPYTYIMLLVIFVIFGVITAVVQPYKKRFLTHLDVFFFNLLAVIMALQLFVLFLTTESRVVPQYMLWVTFVLILIPLLYVSLFVLHWVCQRSPGCVKRRAAHALQNLQCCISCCPRSVFSGSTLSGYVSDGVPDRLEHSFRYRSLKASTSSTCESD